MGRYNKLGLILGGATALSSPVVISASKYLIFLWYWSWIKLGWGQWLHCYC